jgi:hypothetical protein
MIQTIAFETTDKQTFGTVELARQHELELLIVAKLPDAVLGREKDDKIVRELAQFLNENADAMVVDALVDLLTMKATSRPKARKKNRTVKPEATATKSTK